MLRLSLSLAATLLISSVSSEEPNHSSNDSTISNIDSSAVTTPAPITLKKITLKELAAFNGLNGAPTYVAINDTIYDVSGVPSWAKGKHHGNKAGADLTAKIKRSPHGNSVLKKRKVVGLLVK